jgi:hypothetical protein
MALGLPIVGLATPEMATVVQNGVNGYVETDIDRVVEHARRLVLDREEAAALSAGARQTAKERFGKRGRGSRGSTAAGGSPAACRASSNPASGLPHSGGQTRDGAREPHEWTPGARADDRQDEWTCLAAELRRQARPVVARGAGVRRSFARNSTPADDRPGVLI